jgi:hypothetical protein
MSYDCRLLEIGRPAGPIRSRPMAFCRPRAIRQCTISGIRSAARPWRSVAMWRLIFNTAWAIGILCWSKQEMEMNTLMLLIALGTVATVAVLFTGLGSMVKGGEFDDRHSHQLMIVRVGLQAFTLLLLIAAVLLSIR